MTTTFLFWDIDGTLLSTGRAGVFALEEAATEILGEEISLQDMHTSGLTDAQIAAQIVGEDRVERFLELYAAALPGALPRRQGRVLAGVRAILDDLADEPAVRSLLLTGNVAGGARAKLRHYGLDDVLDAGAFCEGTGPRDDIARAAWRLAGEPSPQDCWVIGDTPHDVSCGQAIGAKTLAVATGTHDLAALEACDPTAAVAELPGPGAFRALIGL